MAVVFSDGAFQACTEDRVYYYVGIFYQGEKVFWSSLAGWVNFVDFVTHVFKSVVIYTGVVGYFLGVTEEDCGDVEAFVEEVSCDNEAVAAVVAITTDDRSGGGIGLVEKICGKFGGDSAGIFH